MERSSSKNEKDRLISVACWLIKSYQIQDPVLRSVYFPHVKHYKDLYKEISEIAEGLEAIHQKLRGVKQFDTDLTTSSNLVPVE